MYIAWKIIARARKPTRPSRAIVGENIVLVWRYLESRGGRLVEPTPLVVYHMWEKSENGPEDPEECRKKKERG